MIEKASRSIYKTISWRVTATLTTAILVLLITGSLAAAFSIGVIEFFVKMVLYYFHERIWNKIQWGKKKWWWLS